MALPIIATLVEGSTVASRFLLSVGAVAVYNLFKKEKTTEQEMVNDVIPTPPPPEAKQDSIVSLMAERNQLLHIQNNLLSSLIDVAKAGALTGMMSDEDKAAFYGSVYKTAKEKISEDEKAFDEFVATQKEIAKEKEKEKNSSVTRVVENQTAVKEKESVVAKESAPAVPVTPAKQKAMSDEVVRSLNSYLSKLGEIQGKISTTIPTIVATSIQNAHLISNAVKSLANAKLQAEVKNNVKVQNEVVVKKLNAELSVNSPVEVAFPASVLAYQQSMLNQKTKEVENSTQTLEIYKEQDTYAKTEQRIADLDGAIVTTASPRAVAVQYQATRARVATDINSFELNESDMDILFGNLPDISNFFKIPLPGEIDREI